MMNNSTAASGLRWRWQFAVAAVVLALASGIAVGEALGWPFLAAPLQRLISDALDRRVLFSASDDTSASRSNEFRVRFVGGVRVDAPRLEIAAPAWSSAPHLLFARDVALELGYADLWRAYLGQRLRIHRLQAQVLDAQLERLADGRMSWPFPVNPAPHAEVLPPMPLPWFGDLQVANGTLRYRDVPLAIDIEARLSLADGASLPVAPQAAASSSASANGQPGKVLKVNATGHYRTLPVKIELVSSGVLPWAVDETLGVPVGLTLNATVGRAQLVVKGSAVDALHLSGLTGRFSLKGPSLAAVGDAVHVTLPTTSAFRTDGVIVKRGDTWYARIDDATVGASRLHGAFTYEAGRIAPLLSGRLGGTRLLLADLGPVVGTTPAVAVSTAASAPVPLVASNRAKGRVLPDRPFDLAALRAMDANVLIDIGDVDLNTRLLEPLRPLRGHLQLAGGVLTLKDLDARMGQGRMMGALALDGRGSKALWNADLRWDGVRLESWIHQRRVDGAPPFVSGRLSGRAALDGQGRSTAEILASLKGHVRTELRDGAVSHFVVEAAGVDLAEGLGMLIKGDDMLPVQCAVADLVAEGGVLRPRVMVLDTTDSSVWVDGTLSLATEALDLRAVVAPKDFSPLTLRTPLRVRGSFADPVVSIDKGKLGLRLAGSLLLALVNPLAALIPLIDPGDAEDARRSAAGCQGLMQRSAAKVAAAAPVR